MLLLKGFWAGMLVLDEQVEDKKLEKRAAEIREKLERGEFTHAHVGSVFTLKELCIDVYKNGQFSRMFQFKKE